MSAFRVIFEEDGYPRELASESDRLRAIAAGRLCPDTQVTIYRDGAKPEFARAGEIEELKALFAPPPAPVLDEPAALAPPPPPAPALPQPAPPAAAPPPPQAREERLERADSDSVLPEAGKESRAGLFVGLGVAAFLALVMVVAVVAGPPADKAAVSAPPSSSAPAEPFNTVVAADDARELAEGTIQEWEASGDTHRFRVGDLLISLSASPGEGDPSTPVPVLTATAPGLGEGRVMGVPGFEQASARFVALRPSREDARPSVLLMTFSGGAHCCTSIKLLTPTASGWRTADLGSWDGEGFQETPRDVDGDGRIDFMMADNRFLYAFAPYAMSHAPTQIFNVVDGRFEDVSAAPRYVSVHREDMENARQGCLQRNNGACAAFAASAARVGALRSALEIVASAHDPHSSWNLPSSCAVPRGQDGGCPADQELRPAGFMAALEAFLAEHGFTPRAAALPPATSGPAGFPAERPAVAAIPPQFHGTWASARRDCSDPAYRYSVSAAGLSFPESRATLQRVDAASDERIAMTLSFEGEGRSWTSDFSIELAGGKALFQDAQGFRATLVRC